MTKEIQLVNHHFLSDLFPQDTFIAGIDEVGKGALFGPVVAAAVVLPLENLVKLENLNLKDSKQLSAKKREKYADSIKEIVSHWAIGYAKANEIDRINILQASLLAMKRSILKLKVQPKICLVDGKHPIPNLSIKQKNLIKGDLRSSLIAAASIIAKVWRDDLIVRLFAVKYPQYDLAANKGYGTLKHKQALKKYGPSQGHRISFRPCHNYLGRNYPAREF